jgi:hypothetical protein
MKQILYILLSAVAVFACSNDQADGTDDSRKPIDITYSEPAVVPALAVVDENDYTIYYVDSETGNDDNDGRTAATPFQTLGKINNLPKHPAMKVLLKSGAQFNGELRLKELLGSTDKPFIVDIYGGTARPTIIGYGDQAILVQDEHVRVRNIGMTNKNGVCGIRIQTRSAGSKRNIEITGCRIAEVNWVGNTPFVGIDPGKIDVRAICSDGRFAKGNGGIIVETLTSKEEGASWFENLYLTNNEIYQVARTGIHVSNKWGMRDKQGSGNNEYISDEQNWYPNRNVVIQGNDIRYAGGDGVILSNSTDSWIDHNRCLYANFLGRTPEASAGMWPYNCTNTVVQFNEAAYTQLANGSSDGEGLDVDVACKNTLVQYNYLHHNAGGGLLICNKAGAEHQGTIVRHNVFFHNTTSSKGNMINATTSVGRTDIYNNLVVVTNTYSTILNTSNWGGAANSTGFTFRNNIFMADDPTTSKFNHTHIDDCLFENNLYYRVGNFSLSHLSVLNFDPKITIPENSDGYETVTQYAPHEPRVFRSGIMFDGMPDRDLAGRPTNGINYVGPFANY